MQVKALKIRIVSISALAFVVACASVSKYRWPETNPFAGVVDKDLKSAEAGRAPLRLVFASNVMGEVEPCGCAVGPKGGLDRRLNFLETQVTPQAKEWPFVVADAGNSILPTPRVDEARLESYREVARRLLKAHKDMGVAVQNVGYLDLGFGVDFLKQVSKDTGLPFISASWTQEDGALVFAPTHTVQVSSAVAVTFVGLSAGLEGARPDLKLKVREASASLKEALATIPETHVVVVLSDLGQPKDEELAQEFSSRPMVFVGSRDMGGVSLPKQAGLSLLVQGQFRGQQWGLVDAMIRPKSKGWVLLEKMSDFEKLWSQLVARRDMDRERLKSSHELSLEEARHAETAKDLMTYAPTNYAEKSVYRYRLEDLGDEYRKTNRLSEPMRQMIRLKQ
jgi:2',3'-cyclic-nucleotide 2'-phosphodiesterase (5'-nucleotidase family)